MSASSATVQIARPRRPRLGLTPSRREALRAAKDAQRTRAQETRAARRGKPGLAAAGVLLAAIRELSCARLGLTARELADRLELSHRSGFRLMAALHDAGFVERAAGRAGQYRSLVELRTPLPEAP